MNTQRLIKVASGVLVIGAVIAFLKHSPRSLPEVESFVHSSPHEAKMDREKKQGSRSPASLEVTEKLAREMRNLSQVSVDFRGELLGAWSKELQSSQNTGLTRTLVRAGVEGYRGLDSQSKRFLALSIAQGMMNVSDPMARDFINTLARSHATDSNFLLNLLAVSDPRISRAYYPALLSVAHQWISAHQEFRIEPSIANLKTGDPGAIAAIEGSKFIALDVVQFRNYLAQVR